VLALIDPGLSLVPSHLSIVGALAILRPGVDGDVAGVVASSASIDEEIINALQAEAAELHFDWLLLPEDAFATALTTPGRADLEHRLTPR
jgi:hypothetical protein